ncbi:MAG: DUF885 domain-containing protein [Bacteroidetes bacterium]|nr:DUF885 domain-containing protein [Bacteroidota bacterium]
MKEIQQVHGNLSSKLYRMKIKGSGRMAQRMLIFFFTGIFFSCNPGKKPAGNVSIPQDSRFEKLTEVFIEDLWKTYPSWASGEGNHSFDTVIVVPDEESRQRELEFCRRYLDSLKRIDEYAIEPLHRAEYRVMLNELQAIEWSVRDFREYRWNPAMYNIGESFDKILKGDYITGADKIRILYRRMKNIPDYYLSVQNNIDLPTFEHTRLAIDQHKGTVGIFDKEIRDSLNRCSIGEHEKQMIEERLNKAVDAIRGYIDWLEKSLLPSLTAEKARSFRIGKENYFTKFGFEISRINTAEGIYRKAILYKSLIQEELLHMCLPQWKKYFPRQPQPENKLALTRKIIDTLSAIHPHRDSLMVEVRRQLPALVNFIKKNDLLTIDETKPLVIHETPEYLRGISGASISAPGFFEKEDTTYYNVTPLTGFSSAEAESYLREYNRYTMQILNIHEAIPGHYTQLAYSNQSKSVISGLFHNTAMVEGWAVYSERMMMESGYGNKNNEPDVMDTAMWILYYKWHLRVICNTILDYSIHVLGMSETDALNLLVNEAFQQDTEAREKWKRATLTQVQLASYFTGYLEIYALREEIENRNRKEFNLKKFHEKFLGYGSMPVSIIRQLMLEGN